MSAICPYLPSLVPTLCGEPILPGVPWFPRSAWEPILGRLPGSHALRGNPSWDALYQGCSRLNTASDTTQSVISPTRAWEREKLVNLSKPVRFSSNEETRVISESTSTISARSQKKRSERTSVGEFLVFTCPCWSS